ncbi:integrase catalytic domain-containing protein [Trichonephila clavipes]|uniref:Integrase catalytic domain-containing protein n=1 Tax=Trichonephila clavipes TaxID=2585209 RepID=A0A8X6RJB3_TRICX|nr:integrase catalytic domain-containing protein [Trichonephila clavipes]
MAHNNVRIVLQGFADASEAAYGAVVYLQCFLHNGAAKVSILASKSRFAPIRVISIPRLELCACVLLAQLVKKIRSTLRLNISDIVLHTDSTIILAWLNTPANRLKTFVANRVAKVHELIEGFQWNHVPSVLNQADLVSRGLHPCDLPNLRLWWHGPQFLQKGKLSGEETSLSPVKQCEYSKELKTNSSSDIIISSVCVSTNCVSSILSTLLCKSNSYMKIVRIFSYVLRFSNNVNKRKLTLSGPLSTTDIYQAETKLIRMVQEQVFLAKIKSLQSKGVVSPNSKLRNLNPFIDSDGLLRVGGRLSNSDLSYVNKHPAILPGNHNLTVQIIAHFHRKNLYTGASSLLHYVREKFGPLNGRSLCRKVVHECLICFKSRPLVTSQLMGNLSRDRVVPDYPFNCSGVDFCGPFMISRRGKCAKLYSDNGKTFVGADKELKRFLKLIEDSDDNLAGFLSAEDIEWKLIPPRAPSFGGLWEASVKSIKYHLKRVVSGSNLTYEEFLTVCIQIEGILNSRPLCPSSSNSDDLNALITVHFLIGRSTTSVVEPNLIELKENALKKWQWITRLVRLIWNKWHRCYLSELQQRNKWQFKKQNVKMGDLVVLIEDNMPTFEWPLGRITEIYSGSDALIRVVKVKTQFGEYKRAISRVCLLPMPV